MNTVNDFKVGQRVQSAPHTDRFMRGVRWGNVTKIGKKLITVKFDKFSSPVQTNPVNLRDEFGF